MSGYIGNAPVPQATQTRQTFTATSGQTSFATIGYVAGGQFIQVYLNGVLLKLTDDYTAANGSDIVLTSGASTGDILEFITFADFTVNNQNFTGDLTVDTDTLYVDSANNRVGIGNASPTQALDVTGDIITSGGLYLGGTGSANKISDYETGTWTPTLYGQTTAGTPTYTTREGWYVKVGSMVTVSCTIDLSALSGVAGDTRISGFPFTASATFNTNSNVGLLRLNGVNSEPDGFCVIVIGGGAEVAMRSINANSDTNLLGSKLTNTTGLGFQVSYRTS